MKCRKKAKLIVVKKEKNGVERYFFKYAFPCAQAKVKLGSLSPEEYEKLKETFLENGSPDKETLEKIFPPAFRRIKKLSEDHWNPEIVQKYWEENHNEIIDEGEGMYGNASEEFKDLCKIHIAEVIGKDKDRLLVAYDGKIRKVSRFLVPNADIGDKVRIHFEYAIEEA